MPDRIENNRHLSFFTRKAESTDTHDYIPRHDPDYYKNRKKQNHDHWEDHEKDDAFISIESIIIFLQGLKKDDPSQSETSSAPSRHIPDQSMTKAISAYGGQKNQSEKRYTYLDRDNQQVDLGLIHHLITALQDFQKQGFDNIRLIPADGFLESIQKTVEKIHSL